MLPTCPTHLRCVIVEPHALHLGPCRMVCFTTWSKTDLVSTATELPSFWFSYTFLKFKGKREERSTGGMISLFH